MQGIIIVDHSAIDFKCVFEAEQVAKTSMGERI